jgi:hypothetical protein
LQSRQQNVNPLIGFALAHPKQASLDHLEAVGLEVREQKEQAIFGGGQGAILVDAKLAGGAGFAIESPPPHVGLEGGLKGRYQLLKLVEGQAGQIEEFHRARLHIGESDTRHETCLQLRYGVVTGASYHKSHKSE